MSYEPPATREDLDRIIAERVSRERAKYADYDELKARVVDAEEAKVAAEKSATEAIARAEAAEATIAESESARALEQARAEVAEATGVPANALRGASKEEFEAHAAELKPLITGTGPIIPNQGEEPDKPATTDEAKFAKLSKRSRPMNTCPFSRSLTGSGSAG